MIIDCDRFGNPWCILAPVPTIPHMGPVFDMIPALCILALIPFLCLRDIRTREIPVWWWAVPVFASIPTLYFYLAESTIRNWYYFGISLLFCGVLLCMALLNIIGGADFIFASIITIFVQTNPFHYPRVFFVIDFMIFLCVVCAFVPSIVWAYNTYKGNKYGLVDMFRKIPGHFPGMLIISAAFVIALVAEMI